MSADETIRWTHRIAVVIPSYRVKRHIAAVIAAVGPEVDVIYCVDDACPEDSGGFIEREVHDARVRVLRHAVNLGVGGAVMTGYQRAVTDGARVIVKIDGDGQMDPRLLPRFVAPLLRGEADYTKGNRFYDLRNISAMPPLRIFGNAALSFMSKFSTGYWDLFDPTNGYTAIHADVVRLLPLDKIGQRYFFETDMLFRLNTIRAVIADIPMDARYGDEVSGVKISRILGEFAFKHARNFFKRLFYSYFLRNLSAASLELLVALALLTFGATFGAWHWWRSAQEAVATPVGTIMIATLSLISGLQFLLAFLNYDIASVPKRPLHPLLLSEHLVLAQSLPHPQLANKPRLVD